MANSVDSDQTATKEQSDLGLHSLPRPIGPIFNTVTVLLLVIAFSEILVSAGRACSKIRSLRMDFSIIQRSS